MPFKKCFNPFEIENHRVRDKTNLRNVTVSQLNKLHKDPNLVNLFICNSCRLKLTKLSENEIASTSTYSVENISASSSSSDDLSVARSDVSEVTHLNTDQAIDALNSTLSSLQESPIQKRRLSQQTYPKEKFQKVAHVLGDKLFNVNDPEQDLKNLDLLNSLKEEFRNTEERDLKIRILTLFSSWTYAEIQEHFEATRHMIMIAKKIKEEKGILRCPNQKKGKKLPDSIQQQVVSFYESDEISRLMPGKKDYVTVLEHQEKVQKQKRLIMCNLKEAYKEYKNIYCDEVHIGFSKFAELRPKQCILAGASGTHTVCICAIHQNVKLMLDGCKIQKISENMATHIKTYRDCLQQIICDDPTVECYFNNCQNCPGTSAFMSSLQLTYEEEMIDTITYKQWVTVDRATLETMQNSVEDFLDKLSSSLTKLLTHDFLVKQQSQYFKSVKENILDEECIVTGDFSENYAFIFQDAIQGVHWNNNQATLHPFVIYYKQGSDLKHQSFAAISDCLKHDTIAVHLFQCQLIKEIRNVKPNIKKIIYFTDGAAAQYKNKKNFINLTHHHEDFGIEAEWHFFPTSHGKGACDGIGGTIKRLATRACLQQPNLTIKTPQELFGWADTNITNVKFLYFTKEDYAGHEKHLEKRFERAKLITGTKKFHSFVPINKENLKVREFSNSKIFFSVKITK